MTVQQVVGRVLETYLREPHPAQRAVVVGIHYAALYIYPSTTHRNDRIAIMFNHKGDSSSANGMEKCDVEEINVFEPYLNVLS
jgi:predicted transcriptional regulator